MKAKLIKKGDHFYSLVLIDHEELLATTEDADGALKLSVENCQAIERGYDLDELAKKYAEQENDCYANDYNGFKQGFQKALEILGDKKFTLDDIYTVFIMGREGVESKMNSFVDRIHEPTEWDVEVVTDSIHESYRDGTNKIIKFPKKDAECCIILKRI